MQFLEQIFRVPVGVVAFLTYNPTYLTTKNLKEVG